MVFLVVVDKIQWTAMTQTKTLKKTRPAHHHAVNFGKHKKMYVDGKNHRSLCQTVTIAKHGYFFVYVVVCCWFYKMSKCHGNNNIA